MRIELKLDDDRHFQPGRGMLITGKSGDRDVQVEFFRRQHGRCVLKMRGIDSIDEAQRYVGAEIRIPSNELLPPEEGSFYTFHLKGCSVYDKDEYIGTVSDVLDMGSAQILKVDHNDDETLIPFAQSYMKKIDIAGRRIDVDLPEGLRDLNK